jgi:hypothetical protein
MIITKLTEPWVHYIAENFFPDDLLQEVQTHLTNKVGYAPWTGYKGRIGKPINTYAPNVYSYLCDTIVPMFIKVCEEQLLERGLPTDAHKYEVFHDMFCIDDIGYTVPIHTDILQKCITFIIYINGKGSCTSLLKSHNSEHINSFQSNEFKSKCDEYFDHIVPNSTLVFVPKENTTYHTVHVTKDVRHTVQFTLQLKI